jgi:uncharacterized membrane protein
MFIAILLALVAIVLGIIALNKISVLEGRLRKSRELSEQLQAELKEIRTVISAMLANPGSAARPEPKTSASEQSEPQQAGQDQDQAASVPENPKQETSEPLNKPEPQQAAAAASTPEPAIKAPRRGGLEQALAGRWFVVIGGIAVALGGLLFVKYAHDNGLIPPVLRVLFGYLFAGGLVAAGEYVRRNRPANMSDLVPAALSAAGLVIAFGVTYAAYALYDLISPALCFPLLVAIGLAALWLSRRQGPLIAALGLVGSYVAPALVPSDHPSAWGFFAYLIVIVAATLYELRLRPWWWLGFAGLAGAGVWALLWNHGGLFEQSHVLPVSLFAFALAGAAALIPCGFAILRDDVGSIADIKSIAPPLQIALTGLAIAAAVLGSCVWNAQYTTFAVLLFLAGMAAVAAFGWLKHQNNLAAVLASAFTVLVFMAWPNVSTFVPAFDERGFWTLVPQLIEPKRFVRWMLAAGVGFTALGLAGVLRKTAIRYWDILLAGSAVLFVFGAWAKADFALTETIWALSGAAGLAATAFAAWTMRQRNEEKNAAEATWILLIASALLALFTADRLFDNVWYTLAIAGIAAAFAVASKTINSRAPGWISAALAGFATLRLFVGREFWSEPEGLPFGLHWPIYGYGIPAALFWWASRTLTSPRDDRAKIALEGTSLGLLISLVSLELRVLIGGGITADRMSVLELGSHVTAWLGAAYGLAYRQKISGFIAHWGAISLTAVSSLALLALLTIVNPAFTGDLLQGNAIFNGLWLAYLIPAALMALIINRAAWLSQPPQRTVLAGLAMVLVMSFATLMVKRWYQGPRLTHEFASDAESYTVSLLWLLMGFGAFVAGLRIDRQSIRLGGLIVLILTVLKVFVLDLAGLTGLWRIASLMGLGFSLIGIGWLYTRFVARKALPDQQAEPADSAGKPTEAA